MTGTDASGVYSFTHAQFDQAADDDPYGGCEFLWFFDPRGGYVTTSWPSGDGEYAGDPVELPPASGGAPTVADGTLAAAGQVSGLAVDAKQRAQVDIKVEVLSASTRTPVATVETSPYGGYRVLGVAAHRDVLQRLAAGVDHPSLQDNIVGSGRRRR